MSKMNYVDEYLGVENLKKYLPIAKKMKIIHMQESTKDQQSIA